MTKVNHSARHVARLSPPVSFETGDGIVAAVWSPPDKTLAVVWRWMRDATGPTARRTQENKKRACGAHGMCDTPDTRMNEYEWKVDRNQPERSLRRRCDTTLPLRPAQIFRCG